MIERKKMKQQNNNNLPMVQIDHDRERKEYLESHPWFSEEDISSGEKPEEAPVVSPKTRILTYVAAASAGLVVGILLAKLPPLNSSNLTAAIASPIGNWPGR